MRGTLMRLQTRDQHQAILDAYPDNKAAAVAYRTVPGMENVAPQNVAYWRKIFVDHEGKLATTDRTIANDRKPVYLPSIQYSPDAEGYALHLEFLNDGSKAGGEFADQRPGMILQALCDFVEIIIKGLERSGSGAKAGVCAILSRLARREFEVFKRFAV